MGEWIPEPLPDRAEQLSGRPAPTAADPADRVTLDESVSMAFLVVLESMTPAQRVAFILHDVFAYPFTDVAQIVGRTPAACRQLATSARRRIRAAQAPATPTARQARIVRDFKQAWEAKDINALIGLLCLGGWANIAAALRHYGACPHRALDRCRRLTPSLVTPASGIAARSASLLPQAARKGGPRWPTLRA